MNRFRTFCSTGLILVALLLVTTTRHLTRVSADSGATKDATGSSVQASQHVHADTRHEAPVYVGTKRCRMCHSPQFRSWQRSSKHDAWQSLLPGTKIEAKHHAGLDGTMDYRTDPHCLGCHSVGFGRPGGYTTPDPSDRRAVRAAANREGVGCEACHGPGSAFVELMSEVSENDRPYDPSEFWRVGQTKMSGAVCRDCHNDGAICVLQAGDTPGSMNHRTAFEVVFTDRTGYHEAFPPSHSSKARPSGAARLTTSTNRTESAPR